MILMVDDEPERMDSYKEELAFSDYKVVLLHSIDAALTVLEEKSTEIDLLILDIMMSPGRIFVEMKIDTQDGLRTGVEFYQRLRKKLPSLPVIILTNVSDESVEQFFSREPNCRFFRKEDYYPFELVDEVKEILNAS